MQLGLNAVLLALAGVTAAQNQLPSSLSLGVSSAAYQVEGGWDADGKGQNIWDYLLHTNPEFAYQNANGDVAADTYHHCEDDVQYLQAIGATHYRFSISWSRILPTGKSDYVNEAGVDYYNRLINALVAAGIQPMVTLYHWDLPQPLQDEYGGWDNPSSIDDYVNYARVIFERFADRVKLFITFNEPITTCKAGYEDGSSAPAVKIPGVGSYSCAHHILIAHSRAYRIYEREFKPTHGGRVSITIDTSWYEPNTDNPDDAVAANRNMIWNYEWWINPLFEGDYPQLMKDVVAANSAEEGLTWSRLPWFSEEESNDLRGSFDFIALNFYTSWLCWSAQPWGNVQSSWYRDVLVDCRQPDDWWPGHDWLRYTPWGLRKMLNYIKDRFGNPEVFITENGYSDYGEMKDDQRVEFMRGYLDALSDAINDGCNVSGYTYWSFLDDFEWGAGYFAKFGLIHIDFDDPGRTRSRKYASYIYQNIIETRKIDWDYNPSWPEVSFTDGKLNSTRHLLNSTRV